MPFTGAASWVLAARFELRALLVATSIEVPAGNRRHNRAKAGTLSF